MTNGFRSLVVAAFVFVPSTAQASAPTGDSPPPDTKGGTNVQSDNDLPSTTTGDDYRVDSSPDGTIGAEVRQPGLSGVRGPVSVSGSGPRCAHSQAKYGDFPNVVPPDSIDIPDPGEQINRDVGDRTERGWYRTCGTDVYFYWAPDAVDPVDLIPDALDRARTQLAAPVPAISPGAGAGGIVNLGMWLAVDDPGTTTARATLTDVWAQVTASVSHLEIDLGNGDTVRCDGLGSPIPDSALDSVDQGPCGYTYRRSSPDDDPYQLAITTVHDIAWSTSDGRSGTLAEVRRTTTLGYDVDEIQTIGISN